MEALAASELRPKSRFSAFSKNVTFSPFFENLSPLARSAGRSWGAETLQKDRYHRYDLQKIVRGQKEFSKFELFKKMRQKSTLAPTKSFFATSCTLRPNYSLSLVSGTQKSFTSHLGQLARPGRRNREAGSLQKGRYHGYDRQKIRRGLVPQGV